MIRFREVGCTSVFMRGGGSYRVHIAEHDKVKNAWKAGGAFVDTVGIYGQEISVKLAEVESVHRSTAETTQAMRADEQAEKSEDAITGTD